MRSAQDHSGGMVVGADIANDVLRELLGEAQLLKTHDCLRV